VRPAHDLSPRVPIDQRRGGLRLHDLEACRDAILHIAVPSDEMSMNFFSHESVPLARGDPDPGVVLTGTAFPTSSSMSLWYVSVTRRTETNDTALTAMM